ncbi:MULTISPECIES: hypothetical protein [Rhodomicrobium]|uniref:hypothetical protein n=1 Tax=Rhodomicrobium TaxID=1068 RepID=UPI001FD89BC8|nr:MULTISPECIES: hypothetical protein [Rhodomicrobium]
MVTLKSGARLSADSPGESVSDRLEAEKNTTAVNTIAGERNPRQDISNISAPYSKNTSNRKALHSGMKGKMSFFLAVRAVSSQINITYETYLCLSPDSPFARRWR